MDASSSASDCGALWREGEGEGGKNQQNSTKQDHWVPHSLPWLAGGGGGGKWRGGPPIPMPGMKGIMEGGMKGGAMCAGSAGGTAAAAREGGASANSW